MVPTKSIANVLKKIKKHINTKKGNFPETESLTHQQPPYIGDVGSERPGRRPGRGRGMGRGATRPKAGKVGTPGERDPFTRPKPKGWPKRKPMVPLSQGGSPQSHYLQHGYGPHKIKMTKASDKAVKGNKLTKKA